ncbi:MAG: hypothetical protein WC784_03310 [Candidatus Shapirobacteria bacterium]|jgi:hypothetical protein
MTEKKDNRIPYSPSHLSSRGQSIGVFSSGISRPIEVSGQEGIARISLGSFPLTEEQKEILKKILELPATRRVSQLFSSEETHCN